MSFVVNKQKIAEILMDDEPQVLESEFDLEDLLAAIDSLNNKVKFLEQLKKQRSKSIQSEIDKLQGQNQKLRDVALLTMDNVDKKSLNFPGVGRISVKEGRKSWMILDEEKLIQILNTELGEDDFNRLVQERQVGISKKDINPILDAWEATGKVPDCVLRKVNPSSVTVTISKDADIKDTEVDPLSVTAMISEEAEVVESTDESTDLEDLKI